MPVYLLNEQIVFPPPQFARKDGLLAIGGDLSPERLLLAYRQGIFPWFMNSEPILWWSPDPRLVLYPSEFKASRSLRKKIRQGFFRVTLDQAFNEVIAACARVRLENNEETWIDTKMMNAYTRLHRAGFAHSVEAWRADELAGGVYGVSLGRCFFGESMFTRIPDASKVAMAALVRHLADRSYDFIDCQVTTPHLLRLGAREIPRSLFLKQLRKGLAAPTVTGPWSFNNHS